VYRRVPQPHPGNYVVGREGRIGEQLDSPRLAGQGLEFSTQHMS
jgi:hypothetical protein